MTPSGRRPRPKVAESDVAYLHSRLNGYISQEEYAGVHAELRKVATYLVDGAFADDHRAPPLFELFHRERTMSYAERPQHDLRARFMLALQRDITDLLHKHVEYRRRMAGNVVLEWTGPTGMGKSSCMLGFMERHNRLRDRVLAEGPEALRRRLTIDVADLAHKLPGLEPGDGLALDEQLHLVGEGSESAMKLLRNIEDTIRGTGVDVHWASPTVRDHTTSQGVLEALCVRPPRDGRGGSTRFLYSLALGGTEAIPLGVVDLPWCSAEVFAAYGPIKRRNLERTATMQFHATDAHEETVRKLFENRAVQILLKHREPKKTDWQLLLRRHSASMAVSEIATLASWLDYMWRILRFAPEDFREAFGWEPTTTMRQLADSGKTGRNADD